MNEKVTAIIVTTVVEVTETATAAEDVTEEPTYESVREQVSRTAALLSRAGEYIKHAIPSIIMAVLILVVGVLISKLIAHLVGKAVRKSRIDGAARSFLMSLIRIFLYIIVVIMALSALKVPMSSIITVFGAAGLAVSLALQTCLSNLAGGFIILFSKPFVSGDTIEFDGTVGKVQSISILYTKIATFDGKTVLVPNGTVSSAKLVNYTDTPNRRVDLKFGISYSSDYEKTRAAIFSAIKKNKKILTSPEPVVRMTAHNDSSISIDALVWTANDDYYDVRYSMIENVREEFEKQGIEIPFPQLDVHVKGNEE